MMNIDQARAGEPLAKNKKPEVYETEEKQLNIQIPDGWKSLKNKESEDKDHAAS